MVSICLTGSNELGQLAGCICLLDGAPIILQWVVLETQLGLCATEILASLGNQARCFQTRVTNGQQFEKDIPL